MAKISGIGSANFQQVDAVKKQNSQISNEEKNFIQRNTTQVKAGEIEHKNNEPLTPEQQEIKQQNHQNQLDEIAKMKRANTTTTETIIDKDRGGQRYTLTTKYDNMGNPETITKICENGKVDSINKFKDGKHAEEETFIYYLDDVESYVTTFNNFEKPLQTKSYKNNKLQATTDYKYYDNGVTKESFNYSNNTGATDAPTYNEKILYNDKGQLLRREYSSNLPLADEYTNEFEERKYDDNGNLVYSVSSNDTKRHISVDSSGKVTPILNKNKSEYYINEYGIEVSHTESSKTSDDPRFKEEHSNSSTSYAKKEVFGNKEVNYFYKDEKGSSLRSKTVIERNADSKKISIYNSNGQLVTYSIETEDDARYFDGNGKEISYEEHIKLDV